VGDSVVGHEKEERKTDDAVRKEEHRALEPIGLPILHDEEHDERREEVIAVSKPPKYRSSG
jgi:hypothetical protein